MPLGMAQFVNLDRLDWGAIWRQGRKTNVRMEEKSRSGIGAQPDARTPADRCGGRVRPQTDGADRERAVRRKPFRAGLRCVLAGGDRSAPAFAGAVVRLTRRSLTA